MGACRGWKFPKTAEKIGQARSWAKITGHTHFAPGRRRGRRSRRGSTSWPCAQRMKKATCSRMRRSGILAATCGTASRSRNLLQEPRHDKEIADEDEIGPDCLRVVHNGGVSHGLRLRRASEGAISTGHARAIVASGAQRGYRRFAIREWSLPSVSTGTGGRRRQSRSRGLLQRVPQHALYYDAAAAAGGDVGSGSDKDEEDVWSDHSG